MQLQVLSAELEIHALLWGPLADCCGCSAVSKPYRAMSVLVDLEMCMAIFELIASC